jgi:hypothetical protein
VGNSTTSTTSTTFKDGLHVVMPNVITHPEIQLAIRDHFVDDVSDTSRFADTVLSLTGSVASDGAGRDVGQIYDRSVITSGGGWFLIGSKKPDEDNPWGITRWHRFDTRDGTVSAVDFAAMSTRQVVDALSIRVPPDASGDAPHSPYTRAAEDVMAIAREGTTRTTTNDDNAFVTSIGARQLADLVDLLDGSRATSYDSWMRVGWAISNTRVGTRAERLAVWKAFARRDAKKYVESEHDRAWGRMEVRDGARALGVGTLRFWAKEDAPDAYGRWIRELSLIVTRHDDLVSHLRALGDSGALGDIPNDCVFSTSNEGVAFMAGGVGYTIQLDTKSVYSDDGTYVGNVCSSFPVDESLGFIHKEIPSKAKNYRCNLSESVAVLSGEKIKLALHNAHTPDSARIDFSVEGKKDDSTTSKTKIKTLSTMLSSCMDREMRRILGPDTMNLFVNNGTINIHLSPDTNRHTDEQLIRAVVAANPMLKERYRFVPDAKSSNCNGLFVCDPVTNVWSQRHNVVIEKTLVGMFEGLEITDADRRHVESRRGGSDMVYKLAGEVVDEEFGRRLDANLDLFAVDNGVLDMRTKAFRPIESRDMIRLTTGWSYDSELATAHRRELETFLAQVLPIPDERDVVLAYFASLLSGRRIVRKFLVFTDCQSGANGKSTLSSLMLLFFGKYAKGSTKFVCKGAFDRDRDSHGAGTEDFQGKRLVVADELKHDMTLDVAVIKKYTGGAGNTAEDRKFNSGDSFKFTWQAGFLLIFNEGDCPVVDVGDAAFIGRMVMTPFRAKFVDQETMGAPSEDGDAHERGLYTVPMDLELTARFPDWMPALMDLLVERFDVAPLADSTIPAAMKRLLNDIVGSRNPLDEWLKSHIRVTGVATDRLLISQLKAEYGGDKSFARNIKAYYSQVSGVSIKDGIRASPDGEKAKGVIVGVSRCPDVF